ncbi:MAG: ribosome biogenesis GTPase Der [Clostridiales bacterium]|jgi:GTP-binding protein|nr:ribosome biogenesis GTPase Der [Clostridiales bacterium]
MKPIVAVVGRPNVGKSTLFNRLAGERISIVEDTPGVTRDRIYADCDWSGYDFTLIDTGGLDPESDDIILRQMYAQAEIAVETADVIIFVTDVKTGVTDDDEKIADMLRRARKPVVLAVNKVDNMRTENLDVYEFYRLALGDPVPISAGQALSMGELLDEVIKHFPSRSEQEEEDDVIKVAVIGKPNVGKSSLINKILGEERMIVSDIPGTTRDAVDSPYEREGQKYVFIDTAGLRRKSKIKENIERYSIVRALAAVKRANVCLILISAEEGISEQDVKIAGIAHEEGKACAIVVNKWDKVSKDTKTMDKYTKEIEREFSYMPYAPKIFISALTGQRIHKIFEIIQAVYQNSCMRISTGILNDVLIEAMAITPPPADRGKALRVYYATQVSIKPPTFILFVNDTDLMHYSYKRFIENQIRQNFGFAGTPVNFIVRNKKD